jgi:hypothetical protein
MYPRLMNATLDEWERNFARPIKSGGFSPAAEQLNRSQSTINYAIACRNGLESGYWSGAISSRRTYRLSPDRPHDPRVLGDRQPHKATLIIDHDEGHGVS